MGNYFVIENNGECSPEFFTHIGASSKTEDGPTIGYFGSGSKFALASLLREGIDFAITTGMKTIKFGTKPLTLKAANGESIEIENVFCDINGVITYLNAFPTSFGKHSWNLEKAILEIVSNAIDETGDQKPLIFQSDEIIPSSGITRIFIENLPETSEIFDSLDQFFLCFMDIDPSNFKDGGQLICPQGRKGSPYFRNGRRYNATYRNNTGEEYFHRWYNLPFQVTELREISPYSAKHQIISYYISNPNSSEMDWFFRSNVWPLESPKPDQIETLDFLHYIPTAQRRMLQQKLADYLEKCEIGGAPIVIIPSNEKTSFEKLRPQLKPHKNHYFFINCDLLHALEEEDSDGGKFVCDSLNKFLNNDWATNITSFKDIPKEERIEIQYDKVMFDRILRAIENVFPIPHPKLVTLYLNDISDEIVWVKDDYALFLPHKFVSTDGPDPSIYSTLEYHILSEIVKYVYDLGDGANGYRFLLKAIDSLTNPVPWPTYSDKEVK